MNILICEQSYSDPQLTGRLKKFKLKQVDFTKSLLQDVRQAYPGASISILGNKDFVMSEEILSGFNSKYVHDKHGSLYRKVKLLLSLKKMRFEVMIVVYNSVNRLHNIFFEILAFLGNHKLKMLYEPSFVEILRKSSLNFNKQTYADINNYGQMIKDFHEARAFMRPSFVKKKLTLKEYSLFYTIKNLNFRRVLLQYIGRLCYFIILITGSLYLFVKNIIFLITGQIKKIEIDNAFLNEYYYLPTYALTKTLEAKLFNQIKIDSPSIEIGIESGRVSRLTFKKDNCFDYGLEYYYPTLPAKGECRVFKNLLSGSVFNLPFKDESFNTVVLVHTIDHFEKIDNALPELSRIISKGGRLIFSTYSNDYLGLTPIASLLKSLGFRKLLEKRIEGHSRRYKVYNFFDLNEWKAKLAKCEMDIEQADYFVGKNVAFWVTCLDTLGYFIGHVFPLSGRGKMKQIFPRLSKIIMYPYFLEEYRTRGRKSGNNIFCIFRKRADDHVN